MGGRAVEGTGLENRQGCKLLVGSNPTPSVSSTFMNFHFNIHSPSTFAKPHSLQPSQDQLDSFSKRINAHSIENFFIKATFSKDNGPAKNIVCHLKIRANIALKCLLSAEVVPFHHRNTYTLIFFKNENHKEATEEFVEHLYLPDGQIDLWETTQQYIILEAPERPIAASCMDEIRSFQEEPTSDSQEKNPTTHPFRHLKEFLSEEES